MRRFLLCFLLGCLPFTLVGQTKYLDENGQIAWEQPRPDQSGPGAPKDDCETPIVLHSFASNLEFTAGIASDGDFIWFTGDFASHIYKYSVLQSMVIDSIPNYVEFTAGMCLANGFLYLVDRESYLLVRIDTSNGDMVPVFSLPSENPKGITWDGHFFWLNDRDEDKTYKLDSLGNVVSTFLAGIGSGLDGVAWDGEHLWLHNRYDTHRMDTTTFEVLDCLEMPGGDANFGATFDGQYLWTSNNLVDLIYQIDVGNIATSQADIVTHQEPRVFPNPFVDVIHVDIHVDELSRLDVFDAIGRRFDLDYRHSHQGITTDARDLKEGVYVLVLYLDTGKVLKRRIIKSD